jgi:hypothetical protein
MGNGAPPPTGNRAHLFQPDLRYCAISTASRQLVGRHIGTAHHEQFADASATPDHRHKKFFTTNREEPLSEVAHEEESAICLKLARQCVLR